MSRRPVSAPQLQPVDHDTVRAALFTIPANVERDEWVKIGMAIKAELGDAGLSLWDEWSQQADSYSSADARDTWKSFKAGGGVTIASLLGIAKGHGWKRATGERRPRRTAAEVAADEASKLERQQAEAAELLRQHEVSATRSAALWGKGTEVMPTKVVTYPQRKGVGSYGLRFLPGGVAIVPMFDEDRRLWSIQRLLPKKLRDSDSGQETTDKLYGPPKAEPGEKMASRKTGLFHVLGQVDGSPLLLLAEGYATAATLHQATGRPVVVCFDAGNLLHVARSMRAAWPALPFLICGDDDKRAEAQGKKNAGREKAHAAAELAGAGQGLAAVLLPAGLPDDGSDFNDLAQSAGLAAVTDQVEQAAAALLAEATRQHAGSGDGAANRPGEGAVPQPGAERPPTGTPALRLVAGKKSPVEARLPSGAPGDDAADDGRPSPTDEASRKGRGGRRGRGGDGGGGGGSGGGGSAVPPEWDAFSVNDSGVWYTARDAEGNSKKPMWLCSRLDVTASTRADDGNGWGMLLEFLDPDGAPKTWAMPSSMLSGDGSEWAGRLRDMGLKMATGSAARNLVARYIDTRTPEDRVVCTDACGWHGKVYVLPTGCIGETDEARFVFQSDAGVESNFRQRGTLAQWQTEVAARCVGNSRLVLSVCLSLSGPLMRMAEVENGGLHLIGKSGDGKSTAQGVACSVNGPPSYRQLWRATSNALESVCVQHCDAALILDEIGQIDEREAGEIAYLICNGFEKSRSTRTGFLRKRRSWRLPFLSSGELSLAQLMSESGKTARAGQEVRLLDIPSDAGAGMGVFEDLHGLDKPVEFAEALAAATARSYGAAGLAWVQWICDNHTNVERQLRPMIKTYRERFLEEESAQQVVRSATRFALLAAAGELATEAGITGWAPGVAAEAVRKCYDAWRSRRGHGENGEEVTQVRQVRRFLEQHGASRFQWLDRLLDDRSPQTVMRAGFKRKLDASGKPMPSGLDGLRAFGEEIKVEGCDYLILGEVFRTEVCKGHDHEEVARNLKSRGYLVHDKDRLTKKVRITGMGSPNFYLISPTIFEGDT